MHFPPNRLKIYKIAKKAHPLITNFILGKNINQEGGGAKI